MRCNCGINPKFLTDQHLNAEYRELLIPFAQIRNRLSKKLLEDIPEEMPLGKGHIRFWRDKLGYLRKRHELVIKEKARRGFKSNLRFDIAIPTYLDGDWQCTEKAFGLLKGRIKERIMEKPEFYRYERKVIDVKNYIEMFENQEIFV